MNSPKKSRLGGCTPEKARMLKALLHKGLPQDVCAWLVGVNGGRANDVLHGRRHAHESAANDNELRSFLKLNADKFQQLVHSL